MTLLSSLQCWDWAGVFQLNLLPSPQAGVGNHQEEGWKRKGIEKSGAGEESIPTLPTSHFESLIPLPLCGYQVFLTGSGRFRDQAQVQTSSILSQLGHFPGPEHSLPSRASRAVSEKDSPLRATAPKPRHCNPHHCQGHSSEV